MTGENLPKISPSGTTKRARKLDGGLSSKAVCAIISQCQASGVSELKLGDLFVRFQSSPTRQVEQTSDVSGDFVEPTAQVPTPIGQEDSPAGVPKELIQQYEDAQLLLDSPMAFEQEQIDLLAGRSDGLEETHNR